MKITGPNVIKLSQQQVMGLFYPPKTVPNLTVSRGWRCNAIILNELRHEDIRLECF